ncbi:MAG TPA: FkbM family methyltransferase [Steroidobacteraceae bacterium]|nr:FkbM family methyltransferase [Steroidobacteraceae bacterium]
MSAKASGNSLLAARQKFAAGELSRFQYVDEFHRHNALLFDYPAFLAGTDVQELRITAQGVTVRSAAHDVALFIDPVDLHSIGYTLMLMGQYERPETDFLKSVCGNDGVFLDIGANLGWYSLVLGRRFSGARIYAFEPIPGTFAALRRNIGLNALENIEAVRLGMFNKTGEMNFLFAEDVSGATSLKLVGQTRGQAPVREIACPTTTLDSFCADRNVVPSLVKIDVEGAELMVAQGAETTLAHAPVLMMELLRKWSREFGYHPDDVLALLAKHGYEAWAFAANGKAAKLEPCPAITEETVQTNFVFLHPQEHAAIIRQWT